MNATTKPELKPTTLEDVVAYVNENLNNISDLYSDQNPYINIEIGKAVLAFYGIKTLGSRNGALEQWIKTYAPEIEKDSLAQIINKLAYVSNKYMFDNKVYLEMSNNDTELRTSRPDAMFAYGQWLFGLSTKEPLRLFECEATFVYPAGLPYLLCLRDITPSCMIQLTRAAVASDNKQLRELISETFKSGLGHSHILSTLRSIYESEESPKENILPVLAAMLGDSNLEPAIIDLLATSNLTFNTVVHQLTTYINTTLIIPAPTPTFQ